MALAFLNRRHLGGTDRQHAQPEMVHEAEGDWLEGGGLAVAGGEAGKARLERVEL